jgi:hypothetical protein
LVQAFSLRRERLTPQQERRTSFEVAYFLNPGRAYTPWQALYLARNDRAFNTIAMGVNMLAFDHLLSAGPVTIWNTYPLMMVCVELHSHGYRSSAPDYMIRHHSRNLTSDFWAADIAVDIHSTPKMRRCPCAYYDPRECS